MRQTLMDQLAPLGRISGVQGLAGGGVCLAGDRGELLRLKGVGREFFVVEMSRHREDCDPT